MRRPLSAGAAILAALLAWLAAGLAAAQGIDTQARQAILIDMTTGSVLLEKNADERMPTSSMSKIMTMYMLFEALDQGRIRLDDELTVSERAWRMEGSKMFIEVGEVVRVEDLVRGVIIQSGNDASVVLAEALAGSEEAFADQMNERARALGMTNSHFTNSTGWPDPEHYSTARDLAILAMHLINDFPDRYHYYSELEFTYNDIKQQNRNPLLYKDIGADGLKTGHTEEAGYGLTASAVRDGRRLVLVVNGLSSISARAEESERLIAWGFREFETLSLFKAGDVVEQARTWMGTPDEVPLVPAEDLSVTLRRADRAGMQVSVRVNEPVAVPIAAGDPIATLVIAVPEMPVREVPLVAGLPVEEKGFFGRIVAGAEHMVFSVLE